MKPATNPEIDYKELVKSGYDACAVEYMDARERTSRALDLLLPRLTVGSRVLDLGCGSGVPVAWQLSQQHDVTGVDFSASQIRLARANVPAATFLESDLATLELEAEHYDAILAFYVIFHVPRDDQLNLIRSVWSWLKPGGYFLGTLSYRNEAPYTEDGFFGVEMFWTNFALEEYVSYMKSLGFEIVQSTPASHGFDDDRRLESHPLVLAHKPRDDA